MEEAPEALKALGNEKMKAGDHLAAIQCYTDAIAQSNVDGPPLTDLAEGCQMMTDEPSLLVPLLTNRAAAFLKAGQALESHEDGCRAVQIDPGWSKGYFRSAVALSQLGRHEEAREALLCAHVLKPANKDVLLALQELPLGQIGVHGANPSISTRDSFLPVRPLVLKLWRGAAPTEQAAFGAVQQVLGDGRVFVELFHGGLERADVLAQHWEPGADVFVRQLYNFYLQDTMAELPLPESVLQMLTEQPTLTWAEDAAKFKHISGVSVSSFRWLSARRMGEMSEAADEEFQDDEDEDVNRIAWQVRMTTCLLSVGSVAQKWGLESIDPTETCERVFGG